MAASASSACRTAPEARRVSWVSRKNRTQEGLHLHVESEGNLGVLVASLSVLERLDGSRFRMSGDQLLAVDEWRSQDVLDKLGGIVEELAVSLNIQAPEDQICEFILAVFLEVVPALQDDCLLLGANPENVNFVALSCNHLIVRLVELEYDEDAVDVVRHFHVLDRKVFLVGTQKQITGFRLLQK